MIMRKKSLHKIALLCISFLLILPSKAQNDFEIAKNVDIFVSVLKELNAKYADEISPGTLTQTAIDAMLESLDPYTVFYPESQIENFRIMTTGQYGGVGAIIQQQGDHVVFAELYENSPAAQAGILPGDKILKINGQLVSGKTSNDVSNFLKGEPGTNAQVEIERPSANKKMNFTIVRKEIKLPNIPYYGMVDQHVGYIRMDQFTENAGSEVKEAFIKLKEQGMTSLVFDLRNNGGGLLHEAVNIMNIFVDQNTLIAETKGKVKEQTNTFKTRFPVTDKNIPVVILVNNFSASSSEIVAGAFQDLDRGVIVGKRTFGKGLVQNVLPLSYNTSLKITVSKYYIPSGRCVQNVDYFTKDSLKPTVHIPDSLAVPFKTKNGRTVYDKGGIEPDVATPEVAPSNILIALVMNNLIFDFANQYHAAHPTISPAAQFKVDDVIYKEFTDFLQDKHYTYTTESEEVLKTFQKVAGEEHYFEAVKSLYEEIQKKIEEEKANDLIKFKEEISQFLAGEIILRYYYQKGRIMNSLSYDPDIKEAVSILRNTAKYKSILSGKK